MEMHRYLYTENTCSMRVTFLIYCLPVCKASRLGDNNIRASLFSPSTLCKHRDFSGWLVHRM
jgi:hypothetical protein